MTIGGKRLIHEQPSKFKDVKALSLQISFEKGNCEHQSKLKHVRLPKFPNLGNKEYKLGLVFKLKVVKVVKSPISSGNCNNFEHFFKFKVVKATKLPILGGNFLKFEQPSKLKVIKVLKFPNSFGSCFKVSQCLILKVIKAISSELGNSSNPEQPSKTKLVKAVINSFWLLLQPFTIDQAQGRQSPQAIN